jgi:formyl-CoA transferase
MAVPLIHREYTGAEPKRVGLNRATIAPYGVYAAADGTQVVIAIQTETEWAILCRDVLGRRPRRLQVFSAVSGCA